MAADEPSWTTWEDDGLLKTGVPAATHRRAAKVKRISVVMTMRMRTSFSIIGEG